MPMPGRREKSLSTLGDISAGEKINSVVGDRYF